MRVPLPPICKAREDDWSHDVRLPLLAIHGVDPRVTTFGQHFKGAVNTKLNGVAPLHEGQERDLRHLLPLL